MKKILIVNNNLEMGGIQKSLVNLVKAVHRDYEITLLLFSKSGALLGEIPEGVKIITPHAVYRMLGQDKAALKKQPVLFALKAFLLAFAKVFSRRSAMKLLGLFQKKIAGYDAVLSYSHLPHPNYFANGCGDFVLDRTVCSNKICLIHCDYLNFGGKTEANNRTYMEFDKIACCSQSVRARFLQGSRLPEGKVFTLRNFYDLELAGHPAEDAGMCDPGALNVMTVARLSEEKGIPRAIEALAASGRRDIRYYIVGDGPQKAEILDTIARHQLEDRVILLGEQQQPHKYMCRMDWLLVPSVHEAAPMVFDEAALLGVPVVTTNTTSAEEMVGSRHGIVCENSTEGLVQAFAGLAKPARNSREAFDNRLQRQQLEALLEG